MVLKSKWIQDFLLKINFYRFEDKRDRREECKRYGERNNGKYRNKKEENGGKKIKEVYENDLKNKEKNEYE